MAAAALMNRSRPFMSRCLPRFEVSCVAFTEHVQKSSPWLYCRDGRILSFSSAGMPATNVQRPHRTARHRTAPSPPRGSLAPLLAPPRLLPTAPARGGRALCLTHVCPISEACAASVSRPCQQHGGFSARRK